MSNRLIGPSGGYRKTYSFNWTCLIYHATTLFCRRNYSYKNDQLGKTVGQMVGAARSARQNLVEASSRSATSKEQELKQLDVAKGSLLELAGDYEAFIIDLNEVPWSNKDERFITVNSLELDKFEYTDDVLHDYGVFTLKMRKRCSEWLENENPLIAANSMLICINRACALINGQMLRIDDYFIHEGGFTEKMSKVRIEQRDEDYKNEGSPNCPKCGNLMRKVVARKGRYAGKSFWGCTSYPECKGTREL
jgi:four helix bundle suffix protein